MTSPENDMPIPYCYLLDDTFRVVRAGPPDGSRLVPASSTNAANESALPSNIERVVRMLTVSWHAASNALPVRASATLEGLRVTVASLHEPGPHRMAVIVQRIPAN